MATPRLASQEVNESPTRRVEKSLTLRLAEFYFKYSKADSPTRRVGKSSTPWLTESESRRLPDLLSRVADLPIHRVVKSFLDYEYLREIQS